MGFVPVGVVFAIIPNLRYRVDSVTLDLGIGGFYFCTTIFIIIIGIFFSSITTGRRRLLLLLFVVPFIIVLILAKYIIWFMASTIPLYQQRCGFHIYNDCRDF